MTGRNQGSVCSDLPRAVVLCLGLCFGRWSGLSPPNVGQACATSATGPCSKLIVSLSYGCCDRAKHAEKELISVCQCSRLSNFIAKTLVPGPITKRR